MTIDTIFHNVGFQYIGAKIKYLAIATFLFFPLSVNAETVNFRNQVDFNVHFQSLTSDWRYDDVTRRTRISRAGFGWSETLTPYLSGGLMLGYVDLSQADNPLDTAKITTGYYAGLQLEGQLVNSNYLNLKLNFSFLYNDTQRYASDQRTNNVWTQTEIKLLARIPLGEKFGLRLNVNNYRIRGEQRDGGSISNVSTFRQDESTGYSAGLDVVIDRSASIGFDWLAGNREGGRLYFRRLF